MNWHAFWLLALLLIPAAITGALAAIPGLRELPAWLLVGLGLAVFFAGIKAAVAIDDARRARQESGGP